MIVIYYKRLKDSIKDEISWEKVSKDMDEIVKKAIYIDNYLEEKKIERKKN